MKLVQLAVYAAFGAMSLAHGAKLGPYPHDWPQFGRTSQFQSYNPAPTKASADHAEWTWTAPANLVASPAVAGDLLYVGCSDGGLYQFNLTEASGEPVWSFKTQGEIRSSPAVLSDRSVVFGSYDSNVYRVSAAGNKVWQFSTKSSVYAPASVHNDSVFIGSFDKHLYRIDLETGEQVWSYKTGQAVNSGAAVSDEFGLVVVMGFDQLIHGVHYATGEQAWTFDTGAPSGSTPVIAGALAFVGSWSKKEYGIDLSSGKPTWTYDAGGEIESHAAYRQGVVYGTAEESMRVFAVDAATGKEKWSVSQATQEVNGSPSLTDSVLYYGANDHIMRAVDINSGKLLFEIKTPSNVFSSAAIADNGWVYFGCNSVTGLEGTEEGGVESQIGMLYAINPIKHMQ